jgi:hypothetical protein
MAAPSGPLPRARRRSWPARTLPRMQLCPPANVAMSPLGPRLTHVWNATNHHTLSCPPVTSHEFHRRSHARKAVALGLRLESQPRINTDKHGSSRRQAKPPRRQDTKPSMKFEARGVIRVSPFAVRCSSPLLESSPTRCAGPRSRFGLGLWRAARARSLPLGVLAASLPLRAAAQQELRPPHSTAWPPQIVPAEDVSHGATTRPLIP